MTTLKTIERKLTDNSAVFDVAMVCDGTAILFACISEEDATAFQASLAALIAFHTLDNVREV